MGTSGQIIHDGLHARNSRSRNLLIIVILAFILLLSRFFYIQIINYEYYANLSKENMMTLKIINAPRGKIFDRNGEILVRNRPSYSLSVLYSKLKNKEKVIENLLKIKDMDGSFALSKEQILNTFNKAKYRRFSSVKLADDISFNLVSIINEHILDLPGIIIENETRREYPCNTSAAHILGYMGEINEADFDSLKESFNYNRGELIGKTGIELQYDKLYLRGKNGRKYITVDAFGRNVETITDLPNTPEIKGRDIFLSLDIRLQKAAEEAFPDSLSGAVVAIDPRNGEVLVMASFPSYNPNLFSMSKKKRSKAWQKLVFNKNLPLNNRAITGLYEPASTFKILTSMAGLEEGLITPTHKFPKPCNGGFQFGNRRFKCWKKSGHGNTDMTYAIKQSCDVYFYQLGLLLEMDIINSYARKLGLGGYSGIDLHGEKHGELLDRISYNAKNRKTGYRWSRGMILNSSIGQGQTVTALQLANMAAGLSCGNVIYKPQLLLAVDSLRSGYFKTKLDTLSNLNFDPKNIAHIRHALLEVLRRGGTGGRAAVRGVNVGGKTGTAQNPHGDDHGLFIAAAPIENPTIAIAVIVEHGLHGSSAAAPVAGAILRKYFEYAKKN